MNPTKPERFVCNHYLSEYPNEMGFLDIIHYMHDEKYDELIVLAEFYGDYDREVIADEMQAMLMRLNALMASK